MTKTVVEVVIIVLLILANGLFASSEMAVVSARKARLRRRAEAGDRGAAVALELAEDPNRFLSTVQIGITLVGTLAAAFGGATLGENLATWLRRFPSLEPYAEALGLGAVVLGIAFFSLVLGELVPKRLALGHPERLATLAAVPLRLLSWAAVPAVRVST
jgi:magnesium and cobalt exporter, CNNM family